MHLIQKLKCLEVAADRYNLFLPNTFAIPSPIKPQLSLEINTQKNLKETGTYY